MAKVKFSNTLDPADQAVVSRLSQDIIGKAADLSKNPEVTITSTLRPAAKQARVMYDNLEAGYNINYAAPGREVVAVYHSSKKGGMSHAQIIDMMIGKILELSDKGQRVSLHCVTADQYARMNVIDISRYMSNPRDFVKELIKDYHVKRIITPFESDYNSDKVFVDTKEAAIHIEIQQA